MLDLIYINNVLINLGGFAGFEFDDEHHQIWAYLPYLDVSGTALAYTTFTPATSGEFKVIKTHIESFLMKIEGPNGDKGVEGEAGIEELAKPPAPLTKPKLPLSKPPLPVIKATPKHGAEPVVAASTELSSAPTFSKKPKLKTPFKSTKKFGGPFKTQ